jgi:hypothetical protein
MLAGAGACKRFVRWVDANWEVAHNPSWTVHEDGRTTLD